MTICPFISHLLGEGSSKTLTIGARSSEGQNGGAGDDVVILGYDNEDAQTAVQTQVMTETAERTEASGHLYCLRESCRFYQKASSQCRFDVIHAKLESLEAPKDAPDTPADVARSRQDLEVPDKGRLRDRRVPRRLRQEAGRGDRGSQDGVCRETRRALRSDEPEPDRVDRGRVPRAPREDRGAGGRVREPIDDGFRLRRRASRRTPKAKSDQARRVERTRSPGRSSPSPRGRTRGRRDSTSSSSSRSASPSYLEAGRKHHEEEQARDGRRRSRESTTTSA